MAIRFHHRALAALRSFFRRRTVEDELDAELQFHLQELQAHEAARAATQGRAAAPSDTSLPPFDEAASLARRRFGGLDQVKEACRDMRTLRGLDDLIQDLRFGARLLPRQPVFTAVAVLSLAIGIGANSAIFSLINGVLLRPLPVAQADELYVVEASGEQNGLTQLSYPIFEDARLAIGQRAELAAASNIQTMQLESRSATGGLGHGSASEPIRVQLVSGEYFRLLRQVPQAGRLLTVDDNVNPGQHPVAVISDACWSRRFGRARSALGSELRINGASFTVVGIAAPGFFGTTVGASHAELWLPIMMQAEVRYAGRMTATSGDERQPWVRQRGISWLNIIVRVGPASLGAVSDALTIVARQESTLSSSPTEASAEQSLREHRVMLTPAGRGLSELRAEVTAPLFVLLAMVGLLLAITCANVASLLVARAATRQREIAIRISIGAGRGRLVRQLLTESLLLSVLGAGLGLLVTHWGLGLAQSVAIAYGINVDLDWRVVAFTLIVALACGVGFGLLPALRGTHVRLASALTSQARGGAGDTAGRTTARVLVAGQIALSAFLLVIAALFARSLQELHRVDVGFDRERLIVARIDPRAGGYTPAELPDLHRRLIERIEAVAGVTSASLSSNPPFSGARVRSGFEVEGYVRSGDEQLSTQEEQVTIGYFQTVGLRVLQGRAFGPEDGAHTRRVSVISATMARRLFPNQDAVGKRWGGSTNFDADAFEIIGVVEDAYYGDLKHAPPNMVYLLAAQADQYLNGIEVRVAGRPAALVRALRASLTETEPRLPVTFVRTLDEQVRGTIVLERLLTALTLTFSGVALFLACLGLYGTISYGVSRRRTELGLRMALGARRGAVVWLVMREALWLVGAGLLIGLPLSSVAGRAMRQFFFGITISDGRAHASAVLALLVIAATAAYIPARRASRLDPMLALRAER
jgi:predicted permease